MFYYLKYPAGCSITKYVATALIAAGLTSQFSGSALGESTIPKCTVTLTKSASIFVSTGNEYYEGETMFTHLFFSNLKQGAHVVKAFWRRPNGTVQEYQQLPLHTQDGTTRAYFWIKFFLNTDLILLLGNISEMEKWTVEILLDGKEIATRNFYLWR